MAKLIIKQKILKVLLSNGPTKTGQIAIELGRINENTGYGDYHYVDNDCKKLVKEKYTHIVEPVIKAGGRTGTTYDIIYKLDKLVEMCNKYPALLQDLQANDKIRSMILDKFNYFKNDDLFYTGFKLKLLGSPTFFKLCLIYDLDELENAAIRSKETAVFGLAPIICVLPKELPPKGEKLQISKHSKSDSDPRAVRETSIQYLFIASCVVDSLECLYPNDATLKVLVKELDKYDGCEDLFKDQWVWVQEQPPYNS